MLSSNEKKVFDAIQDFVSKHKYPPSVRELCKATGINSTSTIFMNLKSIQEKGYIDIEKGVARGLILKASKKTNYDRIRNMSIEELAEFLESTNNVMAIKLGGEYIVRAKEYIKIWLESEVTE